MKQFILPPQSGSFEQLTLTDTPIPTPGKGEVLVRVRAVALNYRDLVYTTMKLPHPFLPASDAAGEITATGEGVQQLKPGDRVLGLLSPDWISGPAQPHTRDNVRGGLITPGVLTEYIIGPEISFVKIPDSLSFEAAATLPCAGVTAWHALTKANPLQSGETVLIQGTGGVSLFALQLAKAKGAAVILTSSQDDKLTRGQSLGADHLINYKKTPNWEEEVLKITRGEGADRIIEVGGAATLEKSMRAAKIGGTISLVGILGGNQEKVNPVLISQRDLIVAGIFIGNRSMVEQLIITLTTNRIEPVIDRRFPFEETIAAFRHLASGQHFGKVVITLAER